MCDIRDRLRVGICYQTCRVKNTESGCECAEAADEIDRLTSELKKANEGFEHYERKWYLRGDQNERLQDVLEVLVSNIEYAFPSLIHLGPVKNAREVLEISKKEKWND